VKIFSLSASAAFIFGIILMSASQAQKLAKIHQKIIRDHPPVQHVNQQQLLAMDKHTTVIFDVREQDEFDVSHIEGAIRVDPAASAADFFKQHGKISHDKTLVFYCSVGRRSSSLVQRLLNQEAAVAADLYNLEGGIFSWHNRQQPLYRDEQSTNHVHPYNGFWGRLLERRQLIQYRVRD